jgi:hypothetical protein
VFNLLSALGLSHTSEGPGKKGEKEVTYGEGCPQKSTWRYQKPRGVAQTARYLSAAILM